MCDPLTIGSIAVSAIGTGLQMQSQRRAQNRINSAINQNAESNEKLRRDSQSKVLQSSDQFNRDNFDQTQADETQKVQKLFTDNLSQGTLPGEYYGGAQGENTKKYAEIKSKESTDYSKNIAEALARMRGFDQGMVKNNTGINRAGERVVMNNGFMDGNNAVLPLQIEAAKRSGSNPLADIMVGIGSAGTSAGLSGKSLPNIFGSNPNAIANPNLAGTKYLLA